MFTKEVKELFLMGEKDHLNDSRTYAEAISNIDFEKWLSAMKSEIDSLHINQV